MLCQSLTWTEAAHSASPPLRPGSNLESTAYGRDLLKYIVRCAMPHGKSIDIGHGDEPQVAEGAFGLAPDWSKAPLSPEGRRWVSACVLSFVNALGEHVLISMRGGNPNLRATVTAAERKDFTFQEAAFYGDIFSETPTAYVCRGRGGPVASPSRAKRLCSDPSIRPGVSQCDMIITGNCADVCAKEDPIDHAFSGCRGADRSYDEVVTVFLPVDP
jgi:hypothetical protein